MYVEFFNKEKKEKIESLIQSGDKALLNLFGQIILGPFTIWRMIFPQVNKNLSGKKAITLFLFFLLTPFIFTAYLLSDAFLSIFSIDSCGTNYALLFFPLLLFAPYWILVDLFFRTLLFPVRVINRMGIGWEKKKDISIPIMEGWGKMFHIFQGVVIAIMAFLPHSFAIVLGENITDCLNVTNISDVFILPITVFIIFFTLVINVKICALFLRYIISKIKLVYKESPYGVLGGAMSFIGGVITIYQSGTMIIF